MNLSNSFDFLKIIIGNLTLILEFRFLSLSLLLLLVLHSSYCVSFNLSSHGFYPMSSEFKLEIGNNYDHYESEEIHVTGKNTMIVGVNGNFGTDILSPRERRPPSDSPLQRLIRPNRAAETSSSHHVHEEEKRQHATRKKPSGPLLSGAAYCLSSWSMILLNKVVLSTYNFNAGISLMFYQNLISTVIVAVLNICGAVSVEKLSWKLIRVWLPVNIIFIGMLVSGMYSLKYINIAMVTILKNMTNILTAVGEYYVFRRHQNHKVWTAMFLMIISAVSGGITDLSFDATGYAWQIANCVLTASYSVCILYTTLSSWLHMYPLILRMVMDKAKQLTKSGSLNEVSMVLLNNSLSLPFAIILILMFDEWDYVNNADVIAMPMFWVAATLSGLLGLAISFTSMWFLSQTGPTTYSLVGSLNKLPISLAGILLFSVPVSLPNLFSILFGLVAGVFFARAKMSS